MSFCTSDVTSICCQVVFGYWYNGSPSSIRVSLLFIDGSLSDKDKLPSQIPMVEIPSLRLVSIKTDDRMQEMPDREFLEPKARPPPTWQDHPVILEQLKAKLKAGQLISLPLLSSSFRTG